MNRKTNSIILIFFLIFSILPINVTSDNPQGIFLIQDEQGWIDAGFDPAYRPVYTMDALTDFYMPIALKKEDVKNLKTSDVEHTILHADENFTNRMRDITFEILESETYWVVLYHMTTYAGNKPFEIDFVPKIKGEELGQFAWWNSNWGKRKDIWIDNDQVNETLANFPVFVNISDAEMAGDVQADLDDIAFVTSDNTTQLNHQIEKYSVGATVTACIWVNVTQVNGTIHNSDTHINMYYDNAGCGNQQDPTNVWDSDYEMVYHLNSSTNSGANAMYDSTANARHATYNGTLPSTGVGMVGDGQSFDGNGWGHYNSLPDAVTQLDGTWEIWVASTADSNVNYVMTYWNASNDQLQVTLRKDLTPDRWDSFGRYGGTYEWNPAAAEAPKQNVQGHFYWFGMNWEDLDEANLWRDGVTHWTDGSVDTDDINDGHYYFGTDEGHINKFNGLLDEIRISSIKRNDSWMVASHRTVANDSTFVTIGSEMQDTNINTITGLTVETQSITSITLNWTRSGNGNYTLIERNTISGWARGSGTELYNGTGSTYGDTNCSQSTVYYYRLWAYNESSNVFSNAIEDDNHTGPTNPTSISSSIDGSTITISWTKGTRADNTIVMRKSGSYPAVIGDGTELYNSTGTSHADAGWNNNMYYTLFSYNTTSDVASSGTDVVGGSLNITCKNASDNSTITNFWAEVSNQSGTEAYDADSTDGYINVGVNNLPTGEDVVIQVNASGYEPTIYYMDIALGNYYSLVAYLAPENASNLYYLYVENEYNEPVEKVQVRIEKNVNGSYEEVADLLTDANGYVSVYLVPSLIYKVNLSKSGYDSKTENVIPDPDNYGIYYPIPLRILFTRDVPDIIVPEDIIHFNGTIDSAGTITIWYKDYNSKTIDTAISIYEYSNRTLTHNHTDTKTGRNDFTITQTGYNTSKIHRVMLYLNHTDLDGTTLLSIYLYPLRTTVDEDTIEEYFTDIFGGFELGWVKTFIVFLPALFFLVLFGSQHVGLGVMTAGMYLGFVVYFVNINETASYGMIAMLLVVAGIVAIVIRKMREV